MKISAGIEVLRLNGINMVVEVIFPKMITGKSGWVFHASQVGSCIFTRGWKLFENGVGHSSYGFLPRTSVASQAKEVRGLIKTLFAIIFPSVVALG